MYGAQLFRLVVLIALPAVACKAAPERPVLIRGIPHVLQKPGLGGEACLEMVLRRSGWGLTQDDLFRLSQVDSTTATGCYARKIDRLLGQIGHDHRLVSRPVSSRDEVKQEWRALLADLVKGRASMVCLRQRDSKNSIDVERFKLVIGYDPASRKVVMHDPSRPDGARRRVALESFLRRWPIQPGSRRTVVRIPVEPGPPTTARPAGTPTGRLVRHIALLKQRLSGFSVAAEPPFVVIGNEAAGTVRERARTTVRWATARLKQEYGFRDPPHVIEVWLLGDRASYVALTRKLFGRAPSTPYGYYSSERRVLVMNIALGSGTLVHEMVHPFVEASFPECPPWLNEGLGSLYEACGERDGRIRGFVNWRLAGLKRAIRRGSVPSFRRLTALDSDGFYNRDPGTNYSQSRYLCFYLQEKGLLRRFYRAFRRARFEDPTGYETLRRVLGEPDMAAFQRRWEAYVLGLRDAGGFDPDFEG